MKFFVPTAVGENAAERYYAELAAMAGCRPLPSDQRIHWVRFEHDGEEWTAEVGQTLRGERIDRRRRRSGTVDVTTRLSDPATVLAIFSGEPVWLVVTTARIAGVVSKWENPFLIGPHAVRQAVRFDPPSE